MIPVENIYYLLSYAWNKLDAGNKIDVSKDDYNSLINLFAKVLINATSHLLKRGLDRQYNLVREPYYGIKGKLQLSDSLKRNTFVQGRAICEYDEFNYNTLQNQIIKHTLFKLMFTADVDREHKQSIKLLLGRMQKIDAGMITRSDFKRVRLNKNCLLYTSPSPRDRG